MTISYKCFLTVLFGPVAASRLRRGGGISPVGTNDNSPAIYHWETGHYIILVPQGRLKINISQHRISVRCRGFVGRLFQLFQRFLAYDWTLADIQYRIRSPHGVRLPLFKSNGVIYRIPPGSRPCIKYERLQIIYKNDLTKRSALLL